MTGRESLQGLVLPGQWPLRPPQAALPEHPFLNPGRAGGGGRGYPVGLPTPVCSLSPRSGSAPARTPCGQGLVLGRPGCFPLSQTVAKGLLQLSMCLVQPPLPQAKGACPAPGSPSWQCPAAVHRGALGLAKPQAALSRGRTLNPTPTDTDSSCCTPSLGHPALGAVVWAQLLLVHPSGGLAEHWCRFFCTMGHAFTPALPHPLLPGPSPIWHYILSFTAVTLGTCFCSLHDLLPSPAGPRYFSSPVSRAGRCSARHDAAPVPHALGSFMAWHI